MIYLPSYSQEVPQSFILRCPAYKGLYYEGDPSLLKRRYIAVIGSRLYSPWVETWMEQELLPVLQAENVGVVSGGARGIDQLGHIISLRARQPTLVVLPSGLHRKYPKSLSEQLGQSSLIGYLSEYEADQEMMKYHFYHRNRIIASWCSLLLVVQASERSGTMMTARYAMDLGISIATIPAHPYDRSSQGNNQLLVDGAHIVRGSEDLSSLISLISHERD